MRRNYLSGNYQNDYSGRVAITGMGIQSSIGKNIEEFKVSLKSGYCGIDFIDTSSGSFSPVSICAQIKGFSFDQSINSYLPYEQERVLTAKRIARRSALPIQASVISAMEAWIMSKLGCMEIPRERIGIVVSGSNLTMRLKYDIHQKSIDSPEYVTPSYAMQFMDTDHVGVLSEIFEIEGEGFTVGGASASGNVGIIKACQLIRCGILDVCLVVGALTDLSPTELQAFYNLGAIGGNCFSEFPRKASRPFDKGHEGFIYGQASASLVLESMEFAKKRGVRIQAEILGESLKLDGNRLTDPNEIGEARVMEAALKHAGVQVDEVDYINAHGTSTPLGDITEVNAIRRVFKENIKNIWINSTKCLTGHCLYSAGVVEAAATVIQMNEGFIHPNINLENPIDTECRFVGHVAQNQKISLAISNSFGFGGINSAIVLGAYVDK